MTVGNVSLVLSLICLGLALYGVMLTIQNADPNLCKMTYMFEYPQFTKISFRGNDAFPRYGLYGYSEGHLTEAARNKEWTGAPVVFIPGNSGSFKQVRSLASVALRKGISNNWSYHLDYFAVDLNEEDAAINGGVLEEQAEFVARSVLTVLDLYKGLKNRPQQVVVIGHSIGGKIAQALLLNPDVAPYLNSIVCLSSPLSAPVINLDVHLNRFYRRVQEGWAKNRQLGNGDSSGDNDAETKAWDDKLLISIGGGSRDIQVHAGLTESNYSDVHTLTTSIPGVWLSTDHKCSAWCLELVLVLNRFLYGILKPVDKRLQHAEGHQFVASKQLRLAQAKYYLTNDRVDKQDEREISMITDNRIGEWIENSKRLFSETFPYGLNKTRVQMIRLLDFPQYRYLNVEAINIPEEEYSVLGCAASDVIDVQRYCAKATVITQNLTKLPSVNGERYYFQADLHKLKAKNPTWTHVLLRILPTTKRVRINVDVNEGTDRHVLIPTPKWYSFSEQTLIESTIAGSSIYTFSVNGLESPHQALELAVRPERCVSKSYHAVAKVSVPWAEGYDRYHYFTMNMTRPLYLYVPTAKPLHMNGTDYPVTIRLHLDPKCRFSVTIKNSLGMTMARIMQIYWSWLPAHLVVVLLLAFRYQLAVTPKGMAFKCYPLFKSLLKCGPFFIISAARLFVKMVVMTKFLPTPPDYNHSLMVSVIIHGSSIAILALAVLGLWAAMVFWGNVSYKVLFRIIQLPIPTMNVMVPLIEKLPVAAAVGLISIALMSCGGLALIGSCIVYFMLLTKMYEDFLEEFVYHTAKDIGMKLFGRFVSRRRLRSVQSPRNEPTIPEEPEGEEESEPQSPTESETALVETTSEAVDEAALTEEQKSEREIDRLLKETMEQQSRMEGERRKVDEQQRAEYDSIEEGLSGLHYHFTLFLFLVLQTLLNLPATITWAKNYEFMAAAEAQPWTAVDATTVPTLLTITTLAVIWQLQTPRPQIQGYNAISMALYGMAVITIIYCLDAVFLLNNVIATIFMLVALQQLLSPKLNLSSLPPRAPDHPLLNALR